MGTKENDSYILDMSTSSVAVGKIEIQLRKNEPLPSKGTKFFREIESSYKCVLNIVF